MRTELPRIQLTKFELEIMDVLWRLEEASVREVMDALSEKKRPAYTTVQTIVQRLEQKGAVRRTRKIGNALMFEPAVSKTSAYRRVIDELLSLFGGSAQPVVAHLLESGKLTLEDLKALEEAESAKKAEPASTTAEPVSTTAQPPSTKKGGRK